MKKILKGIATACMSVAVCISFAACGGKGADVNFNDPDGSKYSIITKLDLKVDFEGDKASATVKNTFTLFPAEARVQVYLYYSETEADTYAGMTEVATGSTEDLDQGKSLTASWDTKGRGGYFLGRMRYRIDNREWEEKCTDLYVREYTKPVLEPIADDGSLPVFEDVQPVYRHTLQNCEEIFCYDSFVVDYDGKTIYTEFASNYNKTFKQQLKDDYYIFNLNTAENYARANWVRYGLYRGNEKYYLSHNILLDISDLGYGFEIPNPPPATGLGIWNLGLSFTFIKVNEIKLAGLLNLQFGETFNKDVSQKFINIYIGNDCIATCFYDAKTEKDLSYAFFYNLLVDSLIKNSDI